MCVSAYVMRANGAIDMHLIEGHLLIYTTGQRLSGFYF